MTTTTTPGHRFHREMPANAASVSVARKDLGAWLASHHLDAFSDSATLIVSELTTNVVKLQHSATFRLHVTLTDSHSLRIEVWDASLAKPERQNPGPDDESGRGLWIVDHLADSVGCDYPALEGGKTVWAVLTTD